ncbi:hypothetical protein ACFQL7_20670 [Halocatena marina]|uniref:Uncharacterized protein n=1 Tax=Halocatena marina TaxID=2934937 RepID=A0ABD5YUA3_9EURY|nr:hypothetical protein [Halocatena marina]
MKPEPEPDGLAVRLFDGEQMEVYSDIGDAIQVTPEQVQLVSMDTSTELVSGMLFGVDGVCKLWIENVFDEVDKYAPAIDPITYPDGRVAFEHDTIARRRAGAIARMKVLQ